MKKIILTMSSFVMAALCFASPTKDNSLFGTDADDVQSVTAWNDVKMDKFLGGMYFHEDQLEAVTAFKTNSVFISPYFKGTMPKFFSQKDNSSGEDQDYEYNKADYDLNLLVGIKDVGIKLSYGNNTLNGTDCHSTIVTLIDDYVQGGRGPIPATPTAYSKDAKVRGNIYKPFLEMGTKKEINGNVLKPVIGFGLNIYDFYEEYTSGGKIEIEPKFIDLRSTVDLCLDIPYGNNNKNTWDLKWNGTFNVVSDGLETKTDGVKTELYKDSKYAVNTVDLSFKNQTSLTDRLTLKTKGALASTFTNTDYKDASDEETEFFNLRVVPSLKASLKGKVVPDKFDALLTTEVSFTGLTYSKEVTKTPGVKDKEVSVLEMESRVGTAMTAGFNWYLTPNLMMDTAYNINIDGKVFDGNFYIGGTVKF